MEGTPSRDQADVFAVRWLEPQRGGPAIQLLDQTRLPHDYEILDCRDVATLAEAIRSLRSAVLRPSGWRAPTAWSSGRWSTATLQVPPRPWPRNARQR